MEYVQTVSSYVCRYCKGSFDHLENLQKHVEQIHTARPTKDKFKFCPLCGLRCAKPETYRDHLKHIHRQGGDGKVFVLKCFNDFFVWKNELEKRYYCKYLQQGSTKVIQSTKDKIFVYACDSSASSSKEKKKSSWAARDTCPSMISAIENVTNHTVKVEHWDTHVGHSIPIQGDELDAAIGSLQTTEIVIDEQSYHSSEPDSQSGLYFLTESNDGSYSESYEPPKSQKKQPPALFKNSGNSSPNKSIPRKFSFKKDPTKKSVSFSGSLASVACMKASVKKDPLTSFAASAKVVTVDSQCTPTSVLTKPAASTNAASEAQDSEDSKPKKPRKRRSDAGIKKPKKDVNPENAPVRTRKVRSDRGIKKAERGIVAPTKPSDPQPASQVKVAKPSLNESIDLSGLEFMVKNDNLNGQFILLNSLQGHNGQQSLILCPVGEHLSSPAKPVKSGASQSLGVTKPTETPPPGTSQSLGVTKPTETLSTASNGASGNIAMSSVESETSADPPVESETPAGTSVESETHVEPSVESQTPVEPETPVEPSLESETPAEPSVDSETPVEPSVESETPAEPLVDAPGSGEAEKNTLPTSASVSNTPVTTGSTNVSLSSAETPKQPKKRAPRKKKLPVEEKPPPIVIVSDTPRVIPPTKTYSSFPTLGGTILVPVTTPPGVKNVNSLVKTGGSTIPEMCSVAGNIMSNSLTPGMSYIQVNNTLIPINSPAIPNMNPNFIFAPTVSSAPCLQASQPVSSMNSNFIFTPNVSSAPSLHSSQPVMNLSALTQPSTTKTLVVNSPRPSIAGPANAGPRNMVPPNVPNNLSVFMVPQARGRGPRKDAPATPMSNPRLPNPGNLRPPLIQTNAQFVPPRLLNVAQLCQRLNVPGTPGLTPFRGMTPVAQTLRPCTSVRPPSTANQLGTPKSSTPAINVPSTPIPHPTKPGSFIFESSGDVYVLEPIEDNSALKSVAKENQDLKSGIPKSPSKAQSKVKTEVIVLDPVRSPIKSSPEIPVPESPKCPEKVEFKPRTSKTSRFYDGKRVATLAQKRTYKEEDSDILQKVKYYNLEMKYLTTQAECKRLKLELARKNMKVKGSSETELTKTSQNVPKGNDNSKDSVLEFTDQDSDELIIEKITKNLLTKVEEIEDAKIISSEDFHTESSNNKLESTEEPMECEMDVNETNCDTAVDQLKESTVTNAEESNNDRENKDAINDSLEVTEDMSFTNCGAPNPPLENNKIQDQTMNNSQIDDQTTSNEISVPSNNTAGALDAIAHNRELVDEFLESFEKQPAITSISDQNVAEGQSENLEQNVECNNFEDKQLTVEDVHYYEGKNPNDDRSDERTLKDLETKYGSDYDIYTMIRTSVLRNLYADMQDLCAENKKLFEELQSLKKQGDTYEVIVDETPIEQL